MDRDELSDLAFKLYEYGFSVAIELDPLTLVVRGPLRKKGVFTKLRRLKT